MKKLIISDMSFKFNGQKNYFFHAINISFESGNTYFIQGKNGAGKSTFFSLLQGSTPQDGTFTGEVIFDNTTVPIRNNCMDTLISSQVKTVVQDINTMIVPSMSVQENLQLAQLPIHPRLIPLTHTINLPTIISDFGINQLTKNVHLLSGGQKQILAIIMTLQKPTRILLLDEPTAALDEKNTHMVMQFLTTLAQTLDLIIIVISHDKELTDMYGKNHTILINTEHNNSRSIKLL